ncbi:MAG: CotH kinase family protein [Bacteroides sp.]|nr:CotH kinase family protein [Bacteroides sp.]
MIMTKCYRFFTNPFLDLFSSLQGKKQPVFETAVPTYPEEDPGLSYIYDMDALPHIQLKIKEHDWNKILFAFDKNPYYNYYIPADLTFYKGTDTYIFPQVGIRLRGNSSRKRPEGNRRQLHDPVHPQWRNVSFTLNLKKYNKQQNFFNEKKIHLKWVREDPTYIREVYSYDLYRRYKLYVTPFCSFCRLTIHIEGDPKPAYYGVYKLIEDIDKSFLSHRTAIFGDSAGYLWKARQGADFNTPDRSLMGIKDKSKNYKPIYDLKTHRGQIDQASEQLMIFIKELNSLKREALRSWARQSMDVELFLKTQALSVMLGNWDDYWINSNNFYFYFNKEEGKFFFIPYDMEATLGTSSVLVPDKDSAIQNILKWGQDYPLIQKLIEIPEFRDIYISTYYEINDPTKDLFHYTASAHRIRNWWDLISDFINNDTQEDTRIADEPAWWSNQLKYRLLSTDPPKNYFKVKADSLPPHPQTKR